MTYKDHLSRKCQHEQQLRKIGVKAVRVADQPADRFSFAFESGGSAGLSC